MASRRSRMRARRARRRRPGRVAGRVDAEQGLHDFGAAGADEAVEARGSRRGAARRRCRRTRSGATGPRPSSTGSPIAASALGEDLVDGAADHHAARARPRSRRAIRPSPTFSAVAQDGVAVGDRGRSRRTCGEMKRIALPSAFSWRDDAEEIVDLAAREGGRRLVHDDDARRRWTARGRSRPGASGRRAGRFSRVVGVEVAPRCASSSSRASRAHRAPVDQAERAVRGGGP